MVNRGLWESVQIWAGPTCRVSIRCNDPRAQCKSALREPRTQSERTSKVHEGSRAAGSRAEDWHVQAKTALFESKRMRMLLRDDGEGPMQCMLLIAISRYRISLNRKYWPSNSGLGKRPSRVLVSHEREAKRARSIDISTSAMGKQSAALNPAHFSGFFQNFVKLYNYQQAVGSSSKSGRCCSLVRLRKPVSQNSKASLEKLQYVSMIALIQ